MKKLLLTTMMAWIGFAVHAQVTKVSLQASGLTCSMCSKAVLDALQKVPSVAKVQVDLKSQQYNISFKDANDADFDALSKAVENAGFSVASLKVTANVDKVKAEKDQHLLIGKQYFHFLNADGQQLDGATTFTLVDKAFTSAKNYKKYSALSKKECVQTGKSATCCNAGATAETRIYHALL